MWGRKLGAQQGPGQSATELSPGFRQGVLCNRTSWAHPSPLSPGCALSPALCAVLGHTAGIAMECQACGWGARVLGPMSRTRASRV